MSEEDKAFGWALLVIGIIVFIYAYIIVHLVRVGIIDI